MYIVLYLQTPAPVAQVKLGRDTVGIEATAESEILVNIL
jgi:hypothetical protein